MPYLDEFGLSTYDNNLKEWISSQESKTLTSSIYPWTKTIKAGAVSCYPVGGTELKPVVDFLFTETPPASGDKGPENPSTIVGVSSVIVGRRGKNLYSVGLVNGLGLTFSRDDDGTITINGTCTENTGSPKTFYTNVFSVRPRGKNLVASIRHLGGSFTLPDGVSYPTWVQIANAYSPSLTHYRWMPDDGTDAGSIKAFGLDSYNVSKFDFAAFRVFGGVTYSDYKIRIQYELTDDANPTEYEAPDIDNHAIDLGNTYYGGSIDLATGLMTVTWVGESVEVFYNTSLVGTNTVAFRFDCSYAHGAMSATTGELVCNKFVSKLGDGDNEHCRFVGSAGYDNMFIRFYISKSRLDVSSAINPASPTDAEWRAAANAWLSSNPVFVSYKINNPFAVQLTPTQILSLAQTDKYTPRLNTIYTDASAVQVGYVKSPIREEQELTQAIVAQGGNI